MAQQHIEETQIRELAYYLWLEDGQPQGDDQKHWLKAIDALTPATPKRKPARKAAAKPQASRARAAKPATKAAPKRATKAAKK